MGQSQQLKHKLDRLLTDIDYITWAGLYSFETKLNRWLEQLQAARLSPEELLTLVTQFFRRGPYLMENSDDDGTLGNVFCFEATGIFWSHAVLCSDREHVLQCLLDILSQDDYGLLTNLFEQIADKLPGAELEALVARVHKIFAARGGAKWAILLKSLLGLTAGGDEEVSLFRKAERWLNQSVLAEADAYLRQGQPHQAADSLVKLTYLWEGPVKEDHEVLFAEEVAQIQRAVDVWIHAERAVKRHQPEFLLHSLPAGYLEGVGCYFGRLLLKQKIPTNWLIRSLIKIGRTDMLAQWVHQAPNQLALQGLGRLLSLAATLTQAGFFDEAIQIYRHLVEKELGKKKAVSYKRAISFLSQARELSSMDAEHSQLETHEVFMEKLKQNYSTRYSFWRLMADT